MKTLTHEIKLKTNNHITMNLNAVGGRGVEPAGVPTFTHGLRYRELRFQMPSEKLKNRGR